MASKKIITFDYGATSGRGILGEYDGSRITATELHRFSNDPVRVTGHLTWDVLRLFFELKAGLIKAAIAGHKDIESIGVDTWGVDFGLLNSYGQLIGNPFAYRDELTEGEMERVFGIVPKK
ncbi:MAG: rhamnulokinase, partial [Clostridia bacterium]|nr:rhamnulokinase [Clostridia bacterium]